LEFRRVLFRVRTRPLPACWQAWGSACAPRCVMAGAWVTTALPMCSNTIYCAPKKNPKPGVWVNRIIPVRTWTNHSVVTEVMPDVEFYCGRFFLTFTGDRTG